MKTMKRLMAVAMAFGIMCIVVPWACAQSTPLDAYTLPKAPLGKATISPGPGAPIGACPGNHPWKGAEKDNCADIKNYGADKEPWMLEDSYEDSVRALGQSPGWPDNESRTLCPKCGAVFTIDKKIKNMPGSAG
jgi:hypothetical protein